jgi:hypothetical protein
MTLAVDFDGVIHSYERGWQDGEIYGEVVPGFFEWVEKVRDWFELVVHTSRAKSLPEVLEIKQWLKQRHAAWAADKKLIEPWDMEVTRVKPPAWLTIDDRAIRFEGRWEAPELTPEALLAFKPWMQR